MKIRRIFDFQARICFPNFDNHYDKYLESFRSTNLGLIHQVLPWPDLVKALGLKNNKEAPDSLFSLKGKIALMFLKNYTCESDKKLIEQLNGNINYQTFCDILLT